MNRRSVYRNILLPLLTVCFFSVIATAQSTNQLKLSGIWRVTWNDGNHGPNGIEQFTGINPLNDTLRYMDVLVPMDLNTALQRKGMISDINYGMNYLSARWVAEQYWKYYRQFNVPVEAAGKSTWLKFDRLDYSAKIYLNGQLIGQHDNAFIPCLIDVTGKLKKGKNILTVGIESGLYDAADKSVKDYNNSLNVYLNKRHWLRKPQYQFSWDWNPQLINIGITGEVSLIWRDEARLDNIVPLIIMNNELSSADMVIRTFIEGTKGADNLSIEATLVEKWGYASSGKVVPDYIIYHHLIPVIMKEEDPFRFYWPSSPYSENFEFPNSPITGDQHPWGVSLQKDSTSIWAYRDYVDRFPNEGGVLGASSPATLRQFLPPEQQSIRSFSWDLHDNMMNFVTDKKGVTYKFIEDWLGKDYTDMGFDDYVFASALLQSEGLMEYINNFHRRMYSTSSAIFWMYNDSWPVTHGWTIVDYYLRKKLAYHPVRRAFEPVCVVVLLPGIPYTINIDNGEKVEVKMTGNDIMHR